MYDENNIFAKILRKEIPCDKVHEDEFSLFFNDINPQAKIHVLGIPKFPCTNFSDFLKNADSHYQRNFWNIIYSYTGCLFLIKMRHKFLVIFSKEELNCSCVPLPSLYPFFISSLISSIE